MGDENTHLDDAAARHLLRRTGFGAKPTDVARYSGTTRGAAADTLLGFKPQGFRPNGADFDKGLTKWLKYMVTTKTPLNEKLVLFWHDHFATGFTKVQSIFLMAQQNRTLRRMCVGSMKDLVKAMNKDAAMIEWLDTVRNHKGTPNENYARELQELFTLGVVDFNGNPNYTQADIKQIARAFTGWTYNDKNGQSFFDSDHHDFSADFPGRGPKAIYGEARAPLPNYGGFATPQSFANPEGDTEIDQVIDIIFRHTDSDGKNTVARRTTRRLLEYFCHGGWATPDAGMIARIDTIVADSGFDQTFDLHALLRRIFVDDVFYQDLYPTPSVKWPTDYLVSTLRLLGVKGRGRDYVIEGGDFRPLRDYLADMGQVLLDPPSVFGWDWETSWISSATLLARYGFSRDVTTFRGGAGRFKPEKLVDLTLTDAGDIVDAVTAVLGVGDAFPNPSTERDALIDYLGGPGSTLDLTDFTTRDSKLNGLFVLVLESPAYQVH
jgi:uncharacterized protein (DUF1800 family)